MCLKCKIVYKVLNKKFCCSSPNLSHPKLYWWVGVTRDVTRVSFIVWNMSFSHKFETLIPKLIVVVRLKAEVGLKVTKYVAKCVWTHHNIISGNFIVTSIHNLCV